MTSVRIVGLAVLTAVGTVILGWWSVAVVGAVRGLAPRSGRCGLEAGAGAALGWGALLAWSAARGPVWLLAVRVGAVFGAPGWAFLGLTAIFAALLSASAAEVASGVRRV